MASDDPLRILPMLAFEAILAQLEIIRQGPPIDTGTLSKYKCPIFVSWYANNGDLRGCIGTFQAHPLSKAVRIFSLKSAFEDHRFAGISLEEVSKLSCQVSILIDFEPIPHAFDWEDGIHGLQISFSAGGQSYTSTFLPNVSTIQGFGPFCDMLGWSPMETIHRLIRKAGFQGPINDSLIGKLVVTRYKSMKYEATYLDYLEHLHIV